jgi:hypothetical protein
LRVVALVNVRAADCLVNSAQKEGGYARSVVNCGLWTDDFSHHAHVLDPKSESKVRVSLRDRL